VEDRSPVQARPAITGTCDTLDEDLVDFLQRHEAGPCRDCPIKLVPAAYGDSSAA
jgi:hypothetical protein